MKAGEEVNERAVLWCVHHYRWAVEEQRRLEIAASAARVRVQVMEEVLGILGVRP